MSLFAAQRLHRQSRAIFQRFSRRFLAVADQRTDGSMIGNKRIEGNVRLDHGVTLAECFHVLARVQGPRMFAVRAHAGFGCHGAAQPDVRADHDPA
jgi:hypothetical protein